MGRLAVPVLADVDEEQILHLFTGSQIRLEPSSQNIWILGNNSWRKDELIDFLLGDEVRYKFFPEELQREGRLIEAVPATQLFFLSLHRFTVVLVQLALYSSRADIVVIESVRICSQFVTLHVFLLPFHVWDN